MAQPHTCPVCAGTGTVPYGFYNQIWGGGSTGTITITTGGTGGETCRSCQGQGIVWEPVSAPLAQPLPYYPIQPLVPTPILEEPEALEPEKSAEPLERPDAPWHEKTTCCVSDFGVGGASGTRLGDFSCIETAIATWSPPSLFQVG